MKKQIKLISDFNLEAFYNFLSQKVNTKVYKIQKPNFGLFYEKCFELIKKKEKNHIIFIWSRAEGVIKNFNKIVINERIKLNNLYKEVTQYTDILKQLSKKCDYLVNISWTLPQNERGKYLNDYTDEYGLTNNLNKMNTKIANEMKLVSNFKFINFDFWMKQEDLKFNPKLWYAAKVPFSQKLFESSADELSKIIDTFDGKNKKLIVLDLDNTLWGGILGDLGWNKINIGGHNINGEAYRDFQIKLKSLKNLGIQLAICSKNDEKNALNAIEKNSNMILKKTDFATWRINWNDKAKNINEIISEVNLTNEATVFIDDNIAERQRVKESLRGVLVPDWPEDPSNYVEALQNLRCFDLQQFTYEDKNRTKFYHEEKIRKKNRENFISYNKWLISLKTKVQFEAGNENNKKRITQLINKTNQMNLSTRRISENGLDQITKDKNSYLFSCKVKDKFGDMGLVGVVSFKVLSNCIEVKDFILSCRAFGRSIEKSMLVPIIKILRKKKINKIIFKYVKTQKNKPCLDFLKENLEIDKKNIFIFKKNTKFQQPKFLKIIV